MTLPSQRHRSKVRCLGSWVPNNSEEMPTASSRNQRSHTRPSNMRTFDAPQVDLRSASGSRREIEVLLKLPKVDDQRPVGKWVKLNGFQETPSHERTQRYAFFDLPEHVVGVYVKSNSSPIWRPNDAAVAKSVCSFLTNAGLCTELARPVGVGATAGGPPTSVVESVFGFMKPIGASIHLARFLLGWRARTNAIRRKELLPRIEVTIFADHIAPLKFGPSWSRDTAQLLVRVLPELQKSLANDYPAVNIQYVIDAKGTSIDQVTVRATGGLDISDGNVLKMLKLLSREQSSITIFHREGWFGFPDVFPVKFVVRPLLIQKGRASMSHP